MVKSNLSDLEHKIPDIWDKIRYKNLFPNKIVRKLKRTDIWRIDWHLWFMEWRYERFRQNIRVVVHYNEIIEDQKYICTSVCFSNGLCFNHRPISVTIEALFKRYMRRWSPIYKLMVLFFLKRAIVKIQNDIFDVYSGSSLHDYVE